MAALLLAVAAGCSGDDAPGTAPSAAGGTRPTGSIVPGGTTPSSSGSSSSGPGPTSTGSDGSGGGPTTGSGDPSEGIPQDQFCRGFREVRRAESAMDAALDAEDVAAFQDAFSRLTVAYQAMAENPPDEVLDEMPAVFFMYDEAAGQVASARTISDLTGVALSIQADDRAEDLEVVRDHGAATC